MEKDLSIFKNDQFGLVRTFIGEDGEPWFVANDVATCLGYVNPRKEVVRIVDEEDMMFLQLSDLHGGPNWTPCDNQYVNQIRIINQSGLFSLILSSKMESSKKFKRWITSEVIPSIMKTGSYSKKTNTPAIPDFNNPAEAARAWADQYEQTQKALAEKIVSDKIAEEERSQKECAIKTIETNQPKVDFADTFVAPGENMMLIRDVAKKLEQNGILIAEKNLRELLREYKFMFRNGSDKWELYAKALNNGHGVYRSFFVDKYSGERVDTQTIYMTGKGYRVLVESIKGIFRKQFLKYGEFVL